MLLHVSFLNKNKLYVLFGLIIHIIWFNFIKKYIKIFIKLYLITEYLYKNIY